MRRISEKELILPSLYLLTENDGELTTSSLITSLEKIMKPSGMDMQILARRKDTYFSQKVRNLKSHETLLRKGYAEHIENGFRITAEGRKFVKENIDNITYLINSDFTYQDVKDSFKSIVSRNQRKIVALNELIVEGLNSARTQKVKQRSQKLRNIAIEHFSQHGTIKCDCCNFEFSAYYGPIYGKNCIEIHHLKPIFLYEEGELVQTVDQALQNLLPVCPNCHRVIHKNHITRDGLVDFKRSIAR